ncbi:uncharacterized protein BX663DRAFT_522050, partial [Cokeromyces recurvatus]|uniref:uncharacterized protein n=1 Tax=Cokeromyces recurvatus TaxID=90255 RepID=UPI0022205BA4
LKGYALPKSISGPHLSDSLTAPVKLMAYADDVICLLNSPAELNRLQFHLSLYSLASNARINYNKTEVISLSGSSSIYDTCWRTALHSHGISAWHDCRSSLPVVYLGFPLCSSTKQRDSFLDKILSNIKIACDIHRLRLLSVRGRSTVLNSLILSKLWHVLRVLSVPASFFKSVQSIISNFINFRIFPKVSFNTACLPRSLGGLGLLNPSLQQSALQLRWLYPILSTSTDDLDSNDSAISGSIVLSRIISFLYSQVELYSDGRIFHTPPAKLDHRFFFLFPHRRPPFLRQLTSSLSLLFNAIDMIPKPFSDVVVSAATCLEIPFSSLVISSSEPLRRSMASLTSNYGYIFNSDDENCLRPLQITEILHHPRLTKQVLKRVKKNEIILAPFFIRCFIPTRFAGSGQFPFTQVSDHQVVDISPFLKDLGFFRSPGTPTTPFTTKKFRRMCSQSHLSSPLLPPPFSPKISFPWSQFWQLPLSHSGRNIWYRLIHKKIPHKSFLHRVMPAYFPTSTCPICSDPVESFVHFIFTCPPKLAIWQHMWYMYIDPSDSSFSLDTLYYALHTLHVPSSSLTLVFSPLTAIAATLEAIWLSHWASVFNDTPFTSATTISLLTTKALRIRQESLLSNGIPHAPLPHFMTD